MQMDTGMERGESERELERGREKYKRTIGNERERNGGKESQRRITTVLSKDHVSF